MKISASSRSVLSSCVAVTLLAGCGGSQPPIGVPGAMPQTSALATHAERGKSWMLPKAKSKELLYLSVAGGSYVYAYLYPEGNLEGTLDTPGWGLCSDAKGDVFVTDYPISNIFDTHTAARKCCTRSRRPATRWPVGLIRRPGILRSCSRVASP